MIRSSTGGSQPRYQAPSGYTTAIGPPSQIRRQFALLRRMPPCSDSPSSFSRRFRNSHAATPRSMSQHFGLVCSAQRKMWRRATGIPMVVAIFWSDSSGICEMNAGSEDPALQSAYFVRGCEVPGGSHSLMRPSQSDLLFSSHEYSRISPLEIVNVRSLVHG